MCSGVLTREVQVRRITNEDIGRGLFSLRHERISGFGTCVLKKG